MSDDLANPPQPKPTQAEADEFMADALGFGDDDGTPAWVPSGAKIHIDFLGGTPQGRAWVDGTGEVAVDAVFDVGDGSGYGSTGFTSDGILLGSALAFVLAAATIVFRLMHDGSSDPVTNAFGFEVKAPSTDAVLVTITGPDYNTPADASSTTIESYNGNLNSSASNSFQDAASAANGIASTLTAARLEVAANGGAPLAGVLDETDRPPDNPFNEAQLHLPELNGVTSITIYDPLPTTAGLSALSAVPSD